MLLAQPTTGQTVDDTGDQVATPLRRTAVDKMLYISTLNAPVTYAYVLVRVLPMFKTIRSQIASWDWNNLSRLFN